MQSAMTSVRVEMRRVLRSGLLLGMFAAFAFFGLSGPVLALYMPEILGVAAGTDQLNIQATEATPIDGVALFNQSAMQLGLILAVALAITSLTWDTRAGTSIFYRTRVQGLGAVTIPRLSVDWGIGILSYTLGLVLALGLTTWAIGEVPVRFAVVLWASSVVYLVMAMSLGFLIMTLLRRTATAIALTTVLVLVLPVLSQFEALSSWVPTNLLVPGEELSSITVPGLAAVIVMIVCTGVALLIAGKQTLKRES